MVMRMTYRAQHQITQHKFLLNKKQFCLFIITIFTLSLPFILLAANGSIVNESGLILILPVMAGLPWVLLFLILPFDIPGITSAGIPNEAGNIVASISDVVIMMIPLYINIYLLFLLIIWIMQKNNTK